MGDGGAIEEQVDLRLARGDAEVGALDTGHAVQVVADVVGNGLQQGEVASPDGDALLGLADPQQALECPFTPHASSSPSS